MMQKRTFSRKFSSLRAALLVCLACLAAANVTAQEIKRGGTLVLGGTQVARHLNGAFNQVPPPRYRLRSCSPAHCVLMTSGMRNPTWQKDGAWQRMGSH